MIAPKVAVAVCTPPRMMRMSPGLVSGFVAWMSIAASRPPRRPTAAAPTMRSLGWSGSPRGQSLVPTHIEATAVRDAQRRVNSISGVEPEQIVDAQGKPALLDGDGVGA